MKRFVSVRYDRELASSERDAATRALRSAGATSTSWKATRSQTFASAELDAETDARALTNAAPDAIVDEPALVVLRIVALGSPRIASLLRALGGAGRPAGIVNARREADAIVVAFRAEETPLALAIALVDAELGPGTTRSIEPLVELGDAVLVAFAAAILGDAKLDPSRLIETYLDPLLASA